LVLYFRKEHPSFVASRDAMTLLAILVPLVGAIIGVELAVVLCGGNARRARLLPTVLAGFFIVLAWNASVYGLGSLAVFACLAGALAAHVTDMYRRWNPDR
jgi:hypothetical protein